MRSFEVRCACSAAIPVTAGQAGGVVTCPACGAAVRVPRLGDLRPTANAAADRMAGGSRWSVGHACVLAGGLVAGLATLAGWGVTVSAPRTPPVNEAGIRAAVEASNLEAVLAAWRHFDQFGLPPPEMVGDRRSERRAQATTMIARLLWGAAALAGLIAIGGAATLLFGGSSRARSAPLS